MNVQIIASTNQIFIACILWNVSEKDKTSWAINDFDTIFKGYEIKGKETWDKWAKRNNFCKSEEQK